MKVSAKWERKHTILTIVTVLLILTLPLWSLSPERQEDNRLRYLDSNYKGETTRQVSMSEQEVAIDGSVSRQNNTTTIEDNVLIYLMDDAAGEINSFLSLFVVVIVLGFLLGILLKLSTLFK